MHLVLCIQLKPLKLWQQTNTDYPTGEATAAPAPLEFMMEDLTMEELKTAFR